MDKRERTFILLLLIAVGVFIVEPGLPGIGLFRESAGRGSKNSTAVPEDSSPAGGRQANGKETMDLPRFVESSSVIDPGRGMVNVDGLDEDLIIKRRTIDRGNGELERHFLVKGGGSYPYHRIKEILRYDAVRECFVCVRQKVIVADHIMVKLRDGMGELELEELNRRFGTRTLRSMGFANKYIVKLPGPTLDGVLEFSKLFAGETGLVERVNADSIAATSAVPNDPNWNEQWDKERIDAPAAWDIQTGDINVIVAVIDTGVDIDHSDLADHIWRNPGEAGELATNGVDDDGNGYIDDWIGWDFGQDDNDPDDNGDADKGGSYFNGGHGSHCAGIIGAIGNNTNQVAGVCWNVTIMALKPFEYFPAYEQMMVYSHKAESAMVYAADHGARVTSNSYGEYDAEDSYYDGVDYQMNRGVLFVAAAGNADEGGVPNDNDIMPFWPACIDLSNVISVGSSKRTEECSSYSNFGTKSVDVFAPGSWILSTVPNNSVAFMDGTSMACPQVAGAAALLYSANPDLSYSACKQALMDGVDLFSAYSGKCASNGRLNVRTSLELIAGNDDDNDGLPNDWETFYFGGPTNGNPDVLCSNGMNTVLEAYIAGFSPINPSAGFAITEFTGDRDGLGHQAIEWDGLPNRVYTIYWTPNLQESDFMPLQSNHTGRAFIDTVHGAETAGFYRIGVRLAP